ncbi:hypothetical protein DAPPUDRAFT_239635 [Daphnia pulex]|uniref:Uncharacterized protein n=1 Tax=Daphnia pulex TaxID=6669 RepID=E9G9Q8_DAPPU|nr:hypothetical protein DAPPUDRAFT_239635 [Daphnia pulex]|eukprot:EFX83842.1 hypothetical protein DAPPUDRAFT_239635 [Daphnia pulex]
MSTPIKTTIRQYIYHVTHQLNNLAVLYDVMDKRIRALNSGVNDNSTTNHEQFTYFVCIWKRWTLARSGRG